MIIGSGCGGEKKDDDGGDGTAVAGAGAGGAGAGAGGAGAGGAGAGGAGAGGSGGAAGAKPAGGSGGSGPVMMADAGVEMDAGPPVVVLPMDGNALSVCASSDDCNGDDLVCAVFGTYQGYCAEDCASDDDCAAIGGIAPSCDSEGRCVIDCAAGDGGAGGECPVNMLCAEIMESALDDTTYRCQYPEPKNLDQYALCNLELDDADCKEGLACQLFPGLTDLRDSVCVASCTEASECEALGSKATPVCDPNPLSPLDGICALECEADEDCPDDLTCVEVDLLLGRCGHEL